MGEPGPQPPSTSVSVRSTLLLLALLIGVGALLALFEGYLLRAVLVERRMVLAGAFLTLLSALLVALALAGMTSLVYVVIRGFLIERAARPRLPAAACALIYAGALAFVLIARYRRAAWADLSVRILIVAAVGAYLVYVMIGRAQARLRRS